MHDTLQRFNAHKNTIARTEHWHILLRPAQITLGSLVLICDESAQAFSQISADAHRDLARAILGIEGMLKAAYHFDKINYLMLMMVDREVHFHVIPRYQQARIWQNEEYTDSAWPGPVNLQQTLTLTNQSMVDLLDYLRQHWPLP